MSLDRKNRCTWRTKWNKGVVAFCVNRYALLMFGVVMVLKDHTIDISVSELVTSTT